MKIAVIGAGNVGLTMSVKLGLAGHEIHLISRNRRKMANLRNAEIDLGGIFDDRFVLKNVYDDPEQFFTQEYDFLAICTKTPSLKDVLAKIKKYAPKPMPILSCQNGIGVEEEIASVFGPQYSYRMVINFGGNVLETYVVKTQFFHPPNYVSCLDESGFPLAEEIAHELTKSGLTTEFIPNIKGQVYKKAILNCALSGVCALTRMSMDRAMADEDLVEIVKLLLLEGMQVAHLEGAPLGDDYLQKGMHYLMNAGSHKPSMLIDIETGKRTEIDYLNHQLLKLGRIHHIHLPFTNSITALVRGLEQTSRCCEVVE
ncbi:MAG: ketopantoate reductase family protein [Acidobacteria bacterium]|nr:ketopantoate reductase family protein [Acidobacteriota bacterium]MCB9397487.1 ketopantoate reductase family protein [Acidobacteriota bacterium]